MAIQSKDREASNAKKRKRDAERMKRIRAEDAMRITALTLGNSILEQGANALYAEVRCLEKKIRWHVGFTLAFGIWAIIATTMLLTK